jgi:predicted small secreted protein
MGFATKTIPASATLRWLCLALGFAALTASETVEGLGHDIQSGGAAIEEASEDAR